jgi:SAM-dependent methyltransferase
MAPIDPELLARSWNGMYRAGKYATEPPIPFVSTMLTVLAGRPAIRAGRGLYIGCGNGRNYGALAACGLDLVGLDISEAALEQLARRVPQATGRLACADFRTYSAREPFDYVVAIQVLQHGDQSDVDTYFARVAAILRPGGLFFVRVNSTAAEIFFAHEPLDYNNHGGFSVRCLEGPKLGQPIHFYSRDELLALTAPAFGPVCEPLETHELRPPPRRGRWAQWEGVFERRAEAMDASAGSTK